MELLSSQRCSWSAHWKNTVSIYATVAHRLHTLSHYFDRMIVSKMVNCVERVAGKSYSKSFSMPSWFSFRFSILSRIASQRFNRTDLWRIWKAARTNATMYRICYKKFRHMCLQTLLHHQNYYTFELWMWEDFCMNSKCIYKRWYKCKKSLLRIHISCRILRYLKLFCLFLHFATKFQCSKGITLYHSRFVCAEKLLQPKLYAVQMSAKFLHRYYVIWFKKIVFHDRMHCTVPFYASLLFFFLTCCSWYSSRILDTSAGQRSTLCIVLLPK